MGTSDYVYERLSDPKGIRLLVLHPGERSDPIRISFAQHHNGLSSETTQLMEFHARFWKASRTFDSSREQWRSEQYMYALDCKELGMASALLQANRQNCYGRTRDSYHSAGKLLSVLKKEYKQHDWNKILDDRDAFHRVIPSYKAVSYAWGADDATESILVTRTGSVRSVHDKTMRVRRNVVEMLRQARTDVQGRFWIDALCINQSDVSERESQVRRMGDIYSQAKEVLIWLGPGEMEGKPFPHEPFYGDEHEPANVAKLKSLLNLPWFHRRWIIQEAVLSSKSVVMCGNETIDFELFATRAFFIAEWMAKSKSSTTLTVFEKEALVRLNSMLLLRTLSHSDMQRPMVQLLVDFHASQCSDDRDRLYALKALSSSTIIVDYKQSTEATYWHFAVTEGLQHPGLLLACAGAFRKHSTEIDTKQQGPSSRCSAMPTWAPDWRLPPSYLPFNFGEQSSERVDRINTMDANRTLGCELFSIATVQASLTVKPTMHKYTLVPSEVPFYTDTMLEDSKVRGYYAFFHSYRPCQPEDDAVFVDTITAGEYRSAEDPDHMSNYQDHSLENSDALTEELSESGTPHLWQWSSTLLPTTSLVHDDAPKAVYPPTLSPKRYRDFISGKMTGRCCFFTRSGEFGIGPEQIRPGDEIVTLSAGSRQLIALRRVKAPETSSMAGGDAMTVVGDCYVPELVWDREPWSRDRLRQYFIV